MPIRRKEKSREQRLEELRSQSKAARMEKAETGGGGHILRKVSCLIASDLPGALNLGYLSRLMGYQVDFICDRLDAATKYKKIWPIMVKVCSTEGERSTKGKAVLEWLASTIPFGIRRENFINRYVKTGKWREIPADPTKLPPGIRCFFGTVLGH